MNEINNEEDCGCNATDSEELNSQNVDSIKTKMLETENNLKQIMDSLEQVNFDVGSLSNMEKNLDMMTKFFYSGDFVKSMEKLLDKGGVNLPPEISEIIQNAESYKKEQTVRQPIGYVWIDDNGDQRFSTTEPDNVVSSAVYGD